jgi:hypothetical protein
MAEPWTAYLLRSHLLIAHEYADEEDRFEQYDLKELESFHEIEHDHYGAKAHS